jgi:hypothetical protein
MGPRSLDPEKVNISWEYLKRKPMVGKVSLKAEAC